jgi:hypothetical protein
MMNITWQSTAVVGIVLAAVGYVAYRVVRLIRRKGLPDCGCCPKCPADTPEKPLIDLNRNESD